MGSVLSTSDPKRRSNFGNANPDDDNTSIVRQECSIVRQECLSVKKLKWRKKTRRQEQQCASPPQNQKKITAMTKVMTLRDWILSSPSMVPECSNRGEPRAFSPLFKRVCPTSSEIYESSISITAEPSKARDSFSLERPLKISGEGDREEDAASSAFICRTESGRSIKKVRFRLPEEADVITFYSPEDEY